MFSLTPATDVTIVKLASLVKKNKEGRVWKAGYCFFSFTISRAKQVKFHLLSNSGGVLSIAFAICGRGVQD